MNKSRRVVAIMLALILSMASISAVNATTGEGIEKSTIENASLEVTTIDEVADDVTNVMQDDDVIGEEPEGEETIVIPEVTEAPEESPIPTDTPDVTPEVTLVPTEVPDLSKDAKAILVEGWNGSGNKWQYFKKDAGGNLVQLSQWQDIDGKTFYFDPANSNYAVGGFKLIKDTSDNKNKIYYFEATGDKGVFGAMATGWKNVNGETYFFKRVGAAANKTKGSMLVGWQKIDKQKYYFSKAAGLGNKGRVLTGWQKLDKQKYYFSQSTTLGEKGKALLGWQNIDGQKYYFSKAAAFTNRGRALQGWKVLDGQIYYFSKAAAFAQKGRALQGWRNISGKKFYFDESANFDQKGRMFVGWQKVAGKTYYFSKAKGLGNKGKVLTDWLKLSGQWFYLDGSGVRQENKWMKIKGSWYYFNGSGVALTGWNNIGGLNYYFTTSGANMCKLDQDVRDMVGGPYSATVNRRTNTVTIYGNGGKTPVKAFACSVGMPNTPTPTGVYYTPAKYRWKELMGPSWGQYATRIVGGILFHSVAGSNTTSYNLSAGEYNRLGGPASHGCVRLCVRDAKWIYDNCALGMKVTISDTVYQPFDQPASIKIPAGQTWDPTDPNV